MDLPIGDINTNGQKHEPDDGYGYGLTSAATAQRGPNGTNGQSVCWPIPACSARVTCVATHAATSTNQHYRNANIVCECAYLLNETLGVLRVLAFSLTVIAVLLGSHLIWGFLAGTSEDKKGP